MDGLDNSSLPGQESGMGTGDVAALATSLGYGGPPNESATPAPVPASGTSAVPPVDPFPDMPKSWKVDYKDHWTKLDPGVAKYINEREGQYHKGISGYRNAAQAYAELMGGEHKSFWEQVHQETQGNYNPVQILNQMLGNHLQISKASPESRRAILLQIAKSYGVDFAEAVAQNQASPQPPADPRLEQLWQHKERQEAQARQERLASYEKAVDAMFADKVKFPLADDALDGMQAALNSGVVTTLEDAYKYAIWNNPDLQAKHIQMLSQSTAPGTQPPAVNAAKVNVAPGTSQVGATKPKPKSLEDSLSANFAKLMESNP